MQRRIWAVLVVTTLLTSLLIVTPVGAGQGDGIRLPIPMEISHRLRGVDAPAQLGVDAAIAAATLGETIASQCGGDGSFIVVTIPSFDPLNPMSQDVIFWNETPADSTGKATLWVAWDFLDTAFDEGDEITCEQLAYLQGTMDSIVDTDVYYYGDYVQRPEGNENLDVMIYNIVDESYFDPEYPFYIVGFFWSSINEAFNQNMIFIDSLDWANRLGPDVEVPYLYEATVAHELEHLIHNDHDGDELSWVDEGLADLAEYLNGFGHPDGHVAYYLDYHRNPLTLWNDGLEDYGASYLFQLYLLENFGLQTEDGWDHAWTRALLDEPLNGIAGIESCSGATFNDLYDAWILANLVDDPALTGAGGWSLGYDEIDLNPFVSANYGVRSIELAIDATYGSQYNLELPIARFYSHGAGDRSLSSAPPYAPYYTNYAFTPRMNVWLQGAANSGVPAHSGSYQVASGGGNMVSDRILALTPSVGGTLSFWAWYDMEEEWDYGFVEASTDGGATWAPLAGSITRSSVNPNDSTAWANSLLGDATSTDAAITGNSGGWVEGVFELPAASDVLVRLAYYTDEAINGQGWFVDDVTIDGLSDGFEDGAANWQLGGWEWTTGLYPNDWVVAYTNPVYVDGVLDHLDYDYLAPILSGDNQVLNVTIDTSSLNGDEAIVVASNRPQGSPFNANFLLLVKKGRLDNK